MWRTSIRLLMLCCLLNVGYWVGSSTQRASAAFQEDVVQQCCSMPQPLAGHAACVVRGKIYVIGGGSTQARHFWCYDPQADSWAEMPQSPRSRIFPAMAASGAKLFVCGGFQSRAPGQEFCPPEVDCFDVTTGKWSVVAEMPRPRSRMAGVEHEGKIYLIGGYSEEHGNLSRVDVLDLTELTFSSGPNVPSAIHGAAAAVEDGGLIVVGNQQNGEKAWRWEFDQANWRPVEDAPSKLLFASAVATSQGAVFIGNRARGDIPLLRFDSGNWSTSANVVVNTHRGAAAIIDDTIYCLGGETETGSTAVVLRLRVSQVQWK